MVKQALCLLLSLVLLLSLLPAASATEIELVDEAEIPIVDFPEAQTEEAANGVAQKLAELLALYPDGSSWETSYDGAIQCYGFAGMIVNSVFGSTSSGMHRWWTYAGENKAGMVLVDQVDDCTAANVKAMLEKARPGDVLQFDRGPNGHQHSMIVYDITRSDGEVTGAVIYENNWYSYNQVSLRTLTNYQISLRQACGDGTKREKLSLLTSDNWESVNGGPYEPVSGPEEPPEESTLALTGTDFPNGYYQRMDSYELKGKFTSNYTITRIESEIRDSSGQVVLLYDTPWKKTSYNIQTDGLNYAFRFGSLPRDMFTFTVAATDSSGKRIEAGSAFEIGKPVGTAVPELSWAASTAGLILSWTQVSYSDRYELQRQTGGEWKSLGILTAQSWSEDGLAMGESAVYRVRAHVSSGWTNFCEAAEILFNPFSDVPGSGKTLQYVAWAYNRGIIKGISSTSFAPDRSCSRIQFVMMLWKMHGSPAVGGKNPFSDISGDKTTKAILWALKAGVINSGTQFRPDDGITRGEIVMILWKLAGSPAAEGELPFRDVSGAKTAKAVLWAYQNGITKGTSSTTFAPDKNCTRAQLVTFLYKYNGIYEVI